MTDGTTTAQPPHCPATTDNGRGIVFQCTLPPHPTTPDAHFMERQPEASHGQD